MLELGVKVDTLRRPSAVWDQLRSYAPNLRRTLMQVGLDAVELSFDLDGTEETDLASLGTLERAAKAWHSAGMNVNVHPYTRGVAKPTYFFGETKEPCVQSLRSTLDHAAKLATAGCKPVTVVYHAATVTPAEIEQLGFGWDREPYLEFSQAFFSMGWAYQEQFAGQVRLVVETQIPPRVPNTEMRIGDRPDEMTAILSGRSSGACLDTGHYISSVELLGSVVTPPFWQAVTHMHLHDVENDKDHRPLNAHSHRVAEYTRLARAGGALCSATLEYDLVKVIPLGYQASVPELVLGHLTSVCALVRQWASQLAAF